ncbi:MAG TPA: hypothetical protein VEA61_12160 [Allosphingosinicella sp.]|nr:hypothetical protein [Allosphingosinicella sp.]
MEITHLFPQLPSKLRSELIAEFSELITSFNEGKWRASGLNAGRFCEVCYAVIKGYAEGAHPDSTKKPADLIGKCKAFESDSRLPHGLRFIAARALTVLFEVRNNRNISHVGGSVDPSFMDASLVLANAKWLMAEFVREFHDMPEGPAQSIVDSISQYAPPAVWADDKVRRVLDNSLTYDEKLLVLLASAGGSVDRRELFRWIDHGTQHYFAKRLAGLHSKRQIEAKAHGETVKLLPPGSQRAAKIFSSKGLAH